MRLVLYLPDIAPNVGAAIRIAACFGAGVDIIGPCGFPMSAKDIKRVAMDYSTITQPRLHDGWTSFHNQAREDGHRLLLMTTKAASPIWAHRFQMDDIILLGRESVGVPDEVHECADARLVIPLAPGARSLNVVTAGAVVLSEMARQQGNYDLQ